MSLTEDFRRAGKARHRITIIDPQGGAASQNSFGEVSYVGTTIGSFWGAMEPNTGRILESPMGQRWAEARYFFTMRYQPGLTLTRDMQVQFGGKTLVIIDMNDVKTIRPQTVLILRDYEQ